MKKLSVLILVLSICFAMNLGALAESATEEIVTASLIGTWEAEIPEFGSVAMALGNDGLGEMSMNGESMGSFALMAQGDIVVTYAREESGLELEIGTLAFIDEDTITVTEGEESMTLTRTEKSESAELVLDNPFLGKWDADIPSAGMTLGFEFLTDGSYIVYQDGQPLGLWAYMVYEDAMATIEVDGEVCEYSFAVVDENTLEVTEDDVTVPFVRVAE